MGTLTGGVTSAAGTTLNPGTPTTPGTLSLSPNGGTQLTLSATSVMNFRLSGAPSTVPAPGNDFIDVPSGTVVVGGTVNIGGGLPIGTAALPQAYRLINAPAGVSGSLTLGTLPTGVLATLAVNAGSVDLTVTALPTGSKLWSGAGADGKWSTAANWFGGVAPVGNNSEDLVFPAGIAQQVALNDFPDGTAFRSISVTGGGYTLGMVGTNGVVLGSAANAFSVATTSGTTLVSMNIGGTGGVSINATQAVAGTGTATNTANSTAVTGTNSAFTTQISVGDALTIGAATVAVVSVNSATSITVSPAIVAANTGVAYTIAKGGVVTLSGANTYSGKTSLVTGTLSVSSLNSVANPQAGSNLGAPSSVANGTLSIGSAASAGTLLYTGPGETTDRVIDLAGTTAVTTLRNNSASTTTGLTFSSNFTASGAGAKILVLTGTSTAPNAINGAIVDSATPATSLLLNSFSDASSWTLGGANTFTGTITTFNGTLTIGASGSVSSPSAVTLTNGSTITIAGSYTNSGTGAININNGTINSSGTVTINGASGPITLGNGGTGTWNITGGSVNVNYSGGNGWGIGNASGSTGIVNVTGGTLTTAGNDVFYVGFAIGSTGILNVGGTGTVFMGSGTGLFSIGNATTSACTGTINLNTGGLLDTGRVLTRSPGATGTINFNGGTLRASASSTTFLQNLSAVNVLDAGGTLDTESFSVTANQLISAGGTGVGTLTKNGLGVLTLAGNSALPGTLAVNAGTVIEQATSDSVHTVAANAILNSSGTIANNVSVSSFGTLTGNGTILGAVTVAGFANLNPGAAASPGILKLANTAAALTLNSNSILNFRLPGAPNSPTLGGNGNDGIDASAGPVVLAGAKLNVSGGAGFAVGRYRLINAASYTGTLTVNGLPPGFKGTIDTSITTAKDNVVSATTQITWTGLGADNNWMTAGNWNAGGNPNAVPAGNAAEDLIFPSPATAVQASNNNFANGTLFGTITFNADGYSITGNDIGLSTGGSAVTVSVGTGSVTANLIFNGTQTLNVASGATLAVGGVISGTTPATGLTLIGSGILLLNAANTSARRGHGQRWNLKAWQRGRAGAGDVGNRGRRGRLIGFERLGPGERTADDHRHGRVERRRDPQQQLAARELHRAVDRLERPGHGDGAVWKHDVCFGLQRDLAADAERGRHDYLERKYCHGSWRSDGGRPWNGAAELLSQCVYGADVRGRGHAEARREQRDPGRVGRDRERRDAGLQRQQRHCGRVDSRHHHRERRGEQRERTDRDWKHGDWNS